MYTFAIVNVDQMRIPSTAEVSSQDSKMVTPEETFLNLVTAPAGVLTSGSEGTYMCVYTVDVTD